MLFKTPFPHTEAHHCPQGIPDTCSTQAAVGNFMVGRMALVSGLATAVCLTWLIATGDARTLFGSALSGGKDIAADPGPVARQGVSVNERHAFRMLLQAATTQWLVNCRGDRKKKLRTTPYALSVAPQLVLRSFPNCNMFAAVTSESVDNTERWLSG